MKDKLFRAVAHFDLRLKQALGEESELLYHFLRLLMAVVVLALVVGILLWILSAVFNVVSVIFWAFIAAAPYLLGIAIIAGVTAVVVSWRRKNAQTPSQPEAQAAVPPRGASQKATDSQPPIYGDAIRYELLAADQPTRSGTHSVLASLQHFDHRLQLVISPAHYIDLFGDNWAAVRQFVESTQGRSVPEVSAALVEIVILYKRSQEVRSGADQPRTDPRLVERGRAAAKGAFRRFGRGSRHHAERRSFGFRDDRRTSFATATRRSAKARRTANAG